MENVHISTKTLFKNVRNLLRIRSIKLQNFKEHGAFWLFGYLLVIQGYL